MKLSFDQKLQLSFASLLLVLFTASFLSYLSKTHLVENNRSVNHTQAVLLKLEELQSNLSNSKIAQMVFIVGGDQQWLERYNSNHQLSRQTIRQLRQLVLDNPHQQSRLNSLTVLFEKNYRMLAWAISLKKAQLNEKALQSSHPPEEHAQAIRIQAIIDEMRLEEEHLLRQRSTQTAHSAVVSSISIALAFVLSCLMAFLFFFRFNKDRQLKREIEETLRAKERLITAITQATPDILYVYDLVEQHNVYVNKEMFDVLGYAAPKSQPMAGEFLTELLHPEDMPVILSNRMLNWQALDNQVYPMKYRMRHQNGEYRWLYSREVVFARDEQGRPTQMLGIAQDITEQKNNLDALERSETKYRTMVEEAQDMIYENDFRGYFTYVNPVILRITGYTQEELYGMRYFDLVPPELKGEVIGFYARQLQTRLVTSYFELPIITKDGRRLWIGQNVTFEFDGHSLEMVRVIARDLTALKTAQDLASRAHEVFEATSDFVAFDQGQNQLQVNRSGKRMLGYGEEEEIPENLKEIMQPEWARKVVNEIGIPAALVHGIWTGETALLNRDGREIPVSQLIIAHCNPDGSLKYLSTIARDISIIKQNQREMEDLQHLTESILDSSPSGILALQALRNSAGVIEDFEVLKLNHSAEVFLGKETNELQGKRLGVEVPFFARKKLLNTCRNVVDSGQPANFEKEYQIESVSRWLQFAVVKMDDGLVVTYTDITQRKLAEQQVITQKDFYETILNSIPSDLVVFDAQHRYLFINPVAIRDADFRQWLVGKDDFAFCAYRNKDELLAHNRREIFQRVITGKKQVEWEEQSEEKGGGISYHIRRFNPVFEADGRLRMVIGYGVNITERKRMEEALRTKEALLRKVIDTSPNFIFVRDWDGKYVLANQALANYYGTTVEGLVGKSSQDLEKDPQVIEQTFERDRQIISQCLIQDTPPITTYEQRLLHPLTGEWHWLQTFKVPFILADGTPQVLGVSTDITHSKAVEVDLIQAKEQALQSMKAKEMFLSNMSHEIRTPLNAVIGMTYLLMQENPRADQAEHLKLLRFSAENLLVLINDILDFSKIEAGKIIFESVDFGLPDVLNGIIQSHAYKAEEKKIGLQLQMETTVANILVGDPVRLGQILNNLVSNAVKFTESGGVTLEVKLKKELKTKVILEFQIKDTGIGIAADKLAFVFESFTQAASDTTRRFGGTGLGLAITKRLLELQGSAIQAESTLGVGTTFRFSLTFYKSKLTTLTSSGSFQREHQRSLSHVKVLLVEDNKANQLVASKFLKKWGILPDYANNGLEALEHVQKKRYDVVLMDLQMPEMDGYQATQAIRDLKGEHFGSIPIIALTASAMLDVKDKVFRVGMTDYLPKPFNPNELYSKIAKYAPAGIGDELISPYMQAEQLIGEKEDLRCLEVIQEYLNYPSSMVELVHKLNALLLQPADTHTTAQPERVAIIPEANGAHHTDLTYIREITEGQLDDMREIIESFLITEKEFSDALHEWLSHRNRATLASSAHKMKSCINLVGLEHIRTTLNRMETQAKLDHEPDTYELTQLCQELQRICDASVKELETELIKLS